MISVFINCGGQDNRSAENTIDRRSYVLGGIGTFAEVVDIGIKKLALSAAITPGEMDALIDDAMRIAKENNAEVYREEDFLVTDLFPEEITGGKHVLLIYKGTTKDEYMNLKEKKKQLVQLGQYKGAAREEIARSMGKLLSYPDEKINELLSENSQSESTR